MMIARWLVAIVALYNFGGFLVDAVIPFTSRMHLWNPAWKPHAKFHNVQGMVMGMLLGLLSLLLLFAVPLTPTTFLVAVAVSGIYFWAMLIGQYFPGNIAWADPEFDPILKRFFGMPQQKFVSLALTALLVIAVGVAFLHR